MKNKIYVFENQGINDENRIYVSEIIGDCYSFKKVLINQEDLMQFLITDNNKHSYEFIGFSKELLLTIQSNVLNCNQEQIDKKR